MSRTASTLLSVGMLAACGASGPKTAPQPDEPPVPEPAVLAAVESGRQLFFGRAACSACHKVGEEGNMIVGPNLGVGDGMDEAVSRRASKRRPDAEPIEYVIESILDPDAVVVQSYARGIMKSPDDLPQEISDAELVQLAAFVVAHGEPWRLETAALERAAAAIPAARRAREARAEHG